MCISHCLVWSKKSLMYLLAVWNFSLIWQPLQELPSLKWWASCFTPKSKSITLYLSTTHRVLTLDFVVKNLSWFTAQSKISRLPNKSKMRNYVPLHQFEQVRLKNMQRASNAPSEDCSAAHVQSVTVSLMQWPPLSVAAKSWKKAPRWRVPMIALHQPWSTQHWNLTCWAWLPLPIF